jgi:hypothetical protein
MHNNRESKNQHPGQQQKETRGSFSQHDLCTWAILLIILRCDLRYHGQCTMFRGNTTTLFFGESEVPVSLTTIPGEDGGA